MKRHFAEAQPLVFQKEGCAYAIRPLRKHASPPRPYIRMFPPGVTLSVGVTLGLATVHRCRDAGRSVLRLAFFQQWPFYNSNAFLYSLYTYIHICIYQYVILFITFKIFF